MGIKNLWSCVFVLVSATSTASSSTNVNIPNNYRWHQSVLSIDTRTPPAQIYIEDSKGRMLGSDPALAPNSIGEQNWPYGGLSQIPLSSVEQQDVGDDENGGQPDTTTGWLMSILDGTSQTFVVHLKGVANGATTVFVEALFRKKPGVYSPFPVLMRPNLTKEVEVAFDPVARTIGINRVVNNDDVLKDVESACQLNLIASDRACKHFEEMAEAIQDALEHRRTREAKDLTLNFLFSLGDSRPPKCQEEDDHRFVKEPALTILEEDAKALLQRIVQEPHR
ncbi:MAG TPA: hypothetical protein VMU88_08490 [bacterium]|nr:hypothetical protein [bacterium]